MSDDLLLRDLTAALAPDDRIPSPERIAALRTAAANHTSAAAGATSITRRPAIRMRTTIALAAAASVAAFALGGIVFDDDDRGEGLVAGGVVEFDTTLVAPEGEAAADAVGIRTGIGRIVQLRTDDLPILPTGELYELWFVGPGDTPRTPNRISAGTFHPDERGRSHVDLTAAVDPALYPELSVTAEPGDGRRRRSRRRTRRRRFDGRPGIETGRAEHDPPRGLHPLRRRPRRCRHRDGHADRPRRRSHHRSPRPPHDPGELRRRSQRSRTGNLARRPHVRPAGRRGKPSRSTCRTTPHR